LCCLGIKTLCLFYGMYCVYAVVFAWYICNSTAIRTEWAFDTSPPKSTIVSLFSCIWLIYTSLHACYWKKKIVALSKENRKLYAKSFSFLYVGYVFSLVFILSLCTFQKISNYLIFFYIIIRIRWILKSKTLVTNLDNFFFFLLILH